MMNRKVAIAGQVVAQTELFRAKLLEKAWWATTDQAALTEVAVLEIIQAARTVAIVKASQVAQDHQVRA